MTNPKSQISTSQCWRSRTLINSLAIAVAGLTIFANHAGAQNTCIPPQSAEYLLLIVTQTPEQQERARRSLPQDVNISICRYLNNIVTRVGGFPNPQAANQAAKHFQEKVGLQAYVVQPGVGSPPPTLPPKNPAPTNPTFNPQPLGPGYAVLVDYLGKPELLAQVQLALGTPSTLVSYGQRSYLLVLYTGDQNTATSKLKTLSDRGFVAILVDSRRVIVNLPAN